MGLISKVFPTNQVLNATIETAEKIGSYSQIIMKKAKEAVNTAFETTLKEGLRAEKQMTYCTFATKDRKEGMQAFINKCVPSFSNE